MGITVEFKDFDEMKAFAQELLGVGTEPQTEKPVQQPTPTQAPVAAQPAAVPAAPVSNMTQVTSAVPVTSPAAPVLQAAPAVPTVEHTYTMDDLARAGMGLMDAGRQNDLIQLLSRFGVDTLPALPREQYGAFATALRELGAKI